MTKTRKKSLDLDGWLIRTFPDDLPGHVETKMAVQLDRFREQWQKPGKSKNVRAFEPRWSYLVLARLSLVASSVVLIVLGLSLLPSKSPTALSSSLAVLQKAASVSGQVGSDRTMECTVRLEKGGGPSCLYIINWISPEETRVLIVLDGEESVRTIRPRNTDRSVLEFVLRSEANDVPDLPLLDAELLPVEGLLTSFRLRRLLEGRWLPVGVERTDGCVRESFSIAKASGKPSSKVTVDSCTYLPMKLERYLERGGKLEAVFHWEPRRGPGVSFGAMPS